ncbi:MAG: Rrf2 family transcriptional regulator, partial [candidate division WOR-3 bacterium]
RAGILRGFRGPTGGYCLSRHPSKITAREVIEATEGIRPNVCTQKLGDCPFYPYSRDCMARPLWIELEKTIRDYLDSITIEGLLKNSRRKIKKKKGVAR